MSDPRTTARNHQQRIREALAGRAAANEVSREEKRESVQPMTPAESWEVFGDLVALGRALQGDPTTLHVFEKRQVEELLQMRQIIDKVARGQGHL